MQAPAPSLTPKRSFRHALTWSFVATCAQRGIRIAVLILLAAILAPRDFGLVAMAMAYILFIEMFVAQGFSPAIVQRKQLSPIQLDSLFWLLQAFGLGLAVASIALSRWWASVNGLAALGPVIAVLSLSIPIKSLTIAPRAVMVRQMDFRKMAILDSAAALAAGGISVMMALNGFGVWSLVVQQLLSTGLAVVLIWRVSEWRPRFRFRWRACRELFGFSTGVFVSQIGAYLGDLATVAMMGLFFGPVAVGLYRVASRLTDVVLEIGARSIQVPAFAHLSDLQDRPEELRRVLLKCTRMTATITLPFMALLAVASSDIMAVLGEEWAPAATALGILALFGAVRAITLMTVPLLLARARTKTAARLEWAFGLATVASIAVVAAFVKPSTSEAQVGLVAVMRTVALAGTFGVFSIVAVPRICGMSRTRFVTALVPGAIAAVVTAVIGITAAQADAIEALPAGWRLLATATPAAAAGAITGWLADPTVRGLLTRATSFVFERRIRSVAVDPRAETP